MFDELLQDILEIMPNATVGEDQEGQLVIYTNLRIVSSDGHLAEFEAE